MEWKDWMYLIGILSTFAVSVWSLRVNYKNTRLNNYINTVTSQRIKWIEAFRQDIAAYCGLTHTWFYSRSADKEFDVLRDIDRLRHVITLRLNPNDDLDREVQTKINEIPKLTDSNGPALNEAIQGLIAITQKMLKKEWERVKAESENGNRNTKSCFWLSKVKQIFKWFYAKICADR